MAVKGKHGWYILDREGAEEIRQWWLLAIELHGRLKENILWVNKNTENYERPATNKWTYGLMYECDHARRVELLRRSRRWLKKVLRMKKLVFTCFKTESEALNSSIVRELV